MRILFLPEEKTVLETHSVSAVASDVAVGKDKGDYYGAFQTADASGPAPPPGETLTHGNVAPESPAAPTGLDNPDTWLTRPPPPAEELAAGPQMSSC